jgi:hypothetical protein
VGNFQRAGNGIISVTATLNFRALLPLKPKLVQIIINNSARSSKKTPHFTITKINWLLLFKKVIVVYSENHAGPINTKYAVTDC